MSTINPTLPNPKVVKIEVDQFQSLSLEKEKNMKMEMEMENLVREREWLKKEVDLLENTQSLTKLEKCSLEEKLGRSERKCEELEEKIKKLEDLRQKEIETAAVVDELRVKNMELEKFYKRRIDDLESRVSKVEAALSEVLSVNLANLDKFASDAGDGNGGIGLSKKGQEEDVTNALSGSKRDSKAAESKGRLQDNEDTSPEVKGASCRMSLKCRCTLKTIDVIKDNLHEENLEIFEQSCFGNLLKINEFKFQAHLILQLLLHMDMSASNKERLIFKINNSNMEFGPSDFFRITGLRLGKLEAAITTPSSSIHRDVFQGRPTITMKNIEEAFLSNSSCHKGKGELTLKLALLYFLYGTLLSTRNATRIGMQYLYLIEDLHKFNSYPWGRVAYDILVSSVLQLRNFIDTSQVTHQVENLSIFGFCYALQAWAYEVMPSVAAYCAFRVNNFENITPWILRWSATRIIYSDDLKNFFPLGDKADLNNTVGKSEELSTKTIPHVATQLNRAKRKKRKFLCDNDQMHHAQPSSAATPTTPPPPSMNASTHSSHHLAHRISRAEGMLESLLREFDNLHKNGFPRVDEQDISAATLTRHGTSGSNHVSMNKAHSEVANDNPETNAHVVQSETMQMQMHPLVGRCLSSAAVDVITISDEDDDDDDNEVVAASDSSLSKDSDGDEFLSDRYMNKLVAELKREARGK